MKHSTKRINEWLILIGAFVLLVIGFSYLRSNYILTIDSWINLLSPISSHLLVGHNTVNAMNAFSGKEFEEISFQMIFMIFCIVTIYMIIGPWLFFNGFKLSRQNEDFKKPWQWYIGGIICIASLSVVPLTINSLIVAKNSNESYLTNRLQDNIRVELFDEAFKLAQNVIDEDYDVTADLSETTVLPETNAIVSYSEVISDSSYVLTVTHPDHEFTITTEVYPYKDDFLIIRN